MKRTVLRGACLFCLVLICLLTGCQSPEPAAPEPDGGIVQRSCDATAMNAVWFSYFDLNFAGKTQAQFQSQIDAMFDDVVSFGMNAVICQIRPNSDAYYPSQYFPYSKNLTGVQGQDPGYDPLAYMIDAAHERGLSFHAWLNPYRVSNTSDQIDSLAENNPARVWRTDSDPLNDDYVVTWEKGIYYNPSIPAVQRLIIDGVREILSGYGVDGIHFDDYFYPTTDPAFDAVSYGRYQEQTGENALPLGDWRRSQVDALIQAVCRVVREKDNVVFGISPAAHISTDQTDKNYTEQYADIAKWMASADYIDYIAPQLYFGFDYPSETYRFETLLAQWRDMPRHDTVQLYIGLAAYKIGTEDAKSDEWVTAADILARQAKASAQAGADGVFIYSYGALSADDAKNRQEAAALRDYIKTKE